MDPRNEQALAARIAQVAAAAVGIRGYVSAIDVLVGLGWLPPARVDEWKQRRLPFLEAGVQTNLSRISAAMKLFRAWATAAKLKPSETAYAARTAGREPLRFSKSGAPKIEAAYRTHWISRRLSEAKQARVAEKASRPPELVAIVPRNTVWKCHRCGGQTAFLVMEPPGSTCMACAGLGDLVFLPSGEPKLTRRARAGSKTNAVVVQWSRSRKRYERIGSLVGRGALAAAGGGASGDDARETGPGDDEPVSARSHDDIPF